MSRAIQFAISVFLLAFTSFVPKKNNIIIYGAWHGKKFGDNPKYLFLEAAESNDEIRNIWITKDKTIVDYVKKLGFECYYAYSIKGIFFQIIAKKVVVCVGLSDVVLPLMGGKIIIQLWHGVVLKKIMYDQFKPNLQHIIKNFFLKNMYVLYTNFNNYNKIFRRAFNVDDQHLILSGQPRNDLFYKNEWIDKEWEKKFFELMKGNKSILFMPTHRHEGKQHMELEKHIDFGRINELCKSCGFMFVINRHPYHQTEKKIVGYSNIVDITGLGFDSQYLLSQGDMLITDFSSCYMDYLLKDKPILFYQYDLDQYKQDEREFYYFGKDIMPGYIDTCFEEMFHHLARIISLGIDDYSRERITARDFFYDKKCQGPSSKALYATIKSI